MFATSRLQAPHTYGIWSLFVVFFRSLFFGVTSFKVDFKSGTNWVSVSGLLVAVLGNGTDHCRVNEGDSCSWSRISKYKSVLAVLADKAGDGGVEDRGDDEREGGALADEDATAEAAVDDADTPTDDIDALGTVGDGDNESERVKTGTGGDEGNVENDVTGEAEDATDAEDHDEDDKDLDVNDAGIKVPREHDVAEKTEREK